MQWQLSAEISAGKPKEIVNFSADVPVKYNVDVFVAGGGPAGIAAMVAAAESGADVYAAEALSCFGGMGTSALVPLFMQMTDGINFLAAGFGSRVKNALNSQKSFKGGAHDIETLKRVYDELAERSGAKFTFCTKSHRSKSGGGENRLRHMLGTWRHIRCKGKSVYRRNRQRRPCLHGGRQI